MHKSAKELIQKLADDVGSPNWNQRFDGAKGKPAKSFAEKEKLRAERDTRPPKKYVGPPGGDPRVARAEKEKSLQGTFSQPPAFSKKSSMKNIIDDIIKGAEQNTFGRRVNIQQGDDPSPLDLAKFAGMLQALGEQGYSVKQAAEYLGLTVGQVQDIVATVR